jgi:predicted DNA binding CopG/RHH family protein
VLDKTEEIQEELVVVELEPQQEDIENLQEVHQDVIQFHQEELLPQLLYQLQKQDIRLQLVLAVHLLVQAQLVLVEVIQFLQVHQQ